MPTWTLAIDLFSVKTKEIAFHFRMISCYFFVLQASSFQIIWNSFEKRIQMYTFLFTSCSKFSVGQDFCQKIFKTSDEFRPSAASAVISPPATVDNDARP